MEQLPGIFIYACAALVVPIVLARVVVRADWRTIRNACLLWYGFLMLVLGGYRSAEGFFWVLIIAMFWSIPAVPVISLVMKVWTRLGGHSQDANTTRGDRPVWARFPLARMSPAQWSVTALLLAGFVLFAYWQDQRDLSARAEVLRQYFGLSDDTRFADVRRISKSSTVTPRVEAIVRFSDAQFRVYRDSLDDSRKWPLNTAKYDDASVDVVAPGTIKWRDLPFPTYAGDRRVNWYNLSRKEAASMRQGRVLCIALKRKKTGTQAELRDPTVPRYSARDCADLARTDGGTTVVLGALDFETRSLHMIIN